MTALLEQPSGVDDAFQHLSEVVQDRIARGLSTRSAGVKSALGAKFGGAFDQRLYGFSSFRRFLIEAEQRGLITIAPAASGPDVDLDIPGRQRIEGSVASGTSSGRWVRRDLWLAFVQWDSDVDRFWSVQSSSVVTQKDGVAETDLLIPITPIPPETVKGWMEDFANQSSETICSALMMSLENSSPFRDFRRATDELRQTRSWRVYLQTKVLGVIGAWKNLNELEIDIHEYHQSSKIQRSEKVESDFENEVRTTVRGYVARMTLPELLAVPIPMRLLSR